MTRVVWTASAAEQLGLIRRRDLRWRVYRAVGGLAVFPQRGRIPPEVTLFPDLKLSGELREVVFPRLVRVFYRYDSIADAIYVLGMAFRGQEVGEDWLSRLLED